VSHSVYFQAFLNGQSQPIPTERLLECFAPFITGRDESSIDLCFGNELTSTAYIDITEPTDSGFSIHRPSGSTQEDECCYRAAKLGNFIAMEPGFEGAYYFDHDTPDHLPADLIEGVSELVYVESAEHWGLRDFIGKPELEAQLAEQRAFREANEKRSAQAPALYARIERDGWTCIRCGHAGQAETDFYLPAGPDPMVFCRRCGRIQDAK